MWEIFSRLLPRKSPQVALRSLPIEVNAGPPTALVRHVARLQRLYHALEKTKNKDLAGEIERRKAQVVVLGHPAPANEAEARDLLTTLRTPQ